MRLLKRLVACGAALVLVVISALPAQAALPTATTTDINMAEVELLTIVSPSAILRGEVTNEGGLAVDEVAIVFGTGSLGDPGNVAPAAAGYTEAPWTSVWAGGLGAFYSSGIISLTAATTYYFRAAAHNADGWSYGAEKSFTVWEQRLWYQPNAVISGTTLPDRSVVGGHPGTITWGANPAGLGTTYGPLMPSIAMPTPSGSYHPESIINPAPPAPTPNPSSLTSNILYPIVHLIADNTGFTGKDIVIWRILGAILVFGLIIVSWIIIPNHLLMSGIAGELGMAFLISQSVYPWWALLVTSVYLFATLVSERSPSI